LTSTHCGPRGPRKRSIMEQTGATLKLARTPVYRQQIQGGAVITRLGRRLLLLVCASIVALAQTGQQPGITSITSAANAASGLAPESLGTAMGTDLAAGAASAQSVPWPTTLGGVTVQVTDSAPTPRLTTGNRRSPRKFRSVPLRLGFSAWAVRVTRQRPGSASQYPLSSNHPSLWSFVWTRPPVAIWCLSIWASIPRFTCRSTVRGSGGVHHWKTWRSRSGT
jgi:hypothetical protein